MAARFLSAAASKDAHALLIKNQRITPKRGYFLLRIRVSAYVIIIVMKRYFDIFRKVIDMAPGHKLSLISLFVSDFLNSIATLLPPVATAGIIAVISNGSEFKDIWLYVLIYIVFCII